MLYLLIGEDAAAAGPARAAARAAHMARLAQLQHEGRLVLAGDFPATDSADPGPAGFLGSVVVAEFASLAEAQAWLAAEPYVAEGVFASAMARPLCGELPR